MFFIHMNNDTRGGRPNLGFVPVYVILRGDELQSAIIGTSEVSGANVKLSGSDGTQTSSLTANAGASQVIYVTLPEDKSGLEIALDRVGFDESGNTVVSSTQTIVSSDYIDALEPEADGTYKMTVSVPFSDAKISVRKAAVAATVSAIKNVKSSYVQKKSIQVLLTGCLIEHG